MSFRTRRVLFITPFYMLFEFFLLKYIFLLLGGIDDAYILILTILIGLNHFVPMLFESRKSRWITRFLTTADGVWMWASVLFLIDILIIYLIGSFVNLSVEVNLILLAIVPILGIYNYWHAHKLVIHEKTLYLDNLERDITIAHLSDVHFGSVRHRQIIEQVAGKLRDLEGSCDLAIISGDLADGSSVVEEDDFMALSEVNLPIIFTPGNHDFYPGIENVIRACRKAGMIVLDNESFEFDCINIFGLTFSFGNRDVPTIDESIIVNDKVNILNYHVPYYWDRFSNLGFDVQLSGHTHGGQFYPAVWFADKMFEYNMGLFKDESGKYIHVTTGVGSMDTPMRWGTDSEIVVLRLKKS
ncbi:MAG: metallophosphoesterase [Methanobrevibacter sp.]|uniref:metallophosphoesterase n=1 Tax=Methanobrevibacter sp. TaxID=66852 RepID=UPI001B7721B3|nr:metallophosphoesterase [Methanobrevibacter sp.]MBP3790904.1 metallophosphoesterase [Methanobrevibacter sp.]